MPRNTVNGNKRAKGYFFTETSSGGTPGYVFLDDDKPSEQTMRDFVENTPFFDESGDQAKLDDLSTDLHEKSGLVVLSTDAQAIAKTVKPSNRSLVAQPSQLTSATEEATQEVNTTVDPFTADKIVSVVRDAAVTTRADYRVKLTATFITWLETTLNDLRIAIGTNTSAINIINGTSIPNLQSQITALSTGTGTSFLEQVPVGVEFDWPSNTLPLGGKYKFCDGQSLDGLLYPELYTILGVTYGTAGGNFFNLPDARGKFRATRLAGDPDFGNLNDGGGAASVTLITANLPPHTHEASSNGATINIVSSGAHDHDIVTHKDTANSTGNYISQGDSASDPNTRTDKISTESHIHTNANFAGVVGNGGGTSTAFSVLPPFITGNKIIKVIP